MDNDSSGTMDKRSWRERLGIGTKEMPKISDDFRAGGAGGNLSTSAHGQVAGRPTVKVAQPTSARPVTTTTTLSNGSAAHATHHAPVPHVGAAKAAPRVVHQTARPAVTVQSASPARVTATTVSSESRLEPTVVRRTVQQTPTVTRVATPATITTVQRKNDDLADQLRLQREAAEKLAEQRVQVARERAEAAKPVDVGGKPKFIFADEDQRQEVRVAAPAPAPVVQAPPKAPAPAPAKTRTPLPPRPVPKPVVPPKVPTSPLPPPRAPLGAGGYVPPPRPPVPQAPAYQPMAQPPVPPLTQPGFGMPAGYQMPPPPPAQGYRQMPPPMPPPYRPIDPQLGYAPPPPPFNAPPPMRQAPPAPPPPARYQPPPRQEPVVDYDQYEAEEAYEPEPLAPPPPPARRPQRAPANYQAPGDVFESPAPRRRATAGEYGQAYRELETGFEDEVQGGSRAPWLMMALLGLLLAAALGGVYWWKVYGNPTGVTISGSKVPQVEPPPTPVKAPEPVTPEPTPTSSKKQIYDRIVGEEEVLGNTMQPREEAPQQVEQGTQAEPAPAATGQDGQPLPVPPPPGENGTVGDQGSLSAPSSETTTLANNETTPAASESQAAVAPSGSESIGSEKSDQSMADGGATPEPASALPTPPLPEPAASETQLQEAQKTDVASNGVAPETLTPQPGTGAETPQQETSEVISDEPAPVRVTAKRPKPKKLRTAEERKKTETKSASLGARPVVLVPPSKKAQRIAASTPREQPQRTRAASLERNNGLYGEGQADDTADTSPSVDAGLPLVAEEAVPAVQPKKKTLLGSFFGDKANADVPAVPSPTPDIPAATRVASAGTGPFVAQLGSYRSQAEATRAFSALKSKYPLVVGEFTPLIGTALVAGSTRYRLGVGPLPNQAAASALCSRLVAAGERDCSAGRQ